MDDLSSAELRRVLDAAAAARGPRLDVRDDADAAAAAAAGLIERAARSAIDQRGSFRIALSGGSTPERLYHLLASHPFRDRIDWARTRIYFADERGVPPDDPESNFRLVREALLLPAGIPEANVHRMRADMDDLDGAAREYEVALTEPLDLIQLGVGPDGHTASLFPHLSAVGERVRRVLAVFDSPKPPARRMTLAPPALREARDVLVLVTGADKAEAVARALAPGMRPDECPAALMAARDWIVDRSAAAAVRR
jgi:6-phosphogluconolactonase